jgi:LemA protein
MPERIKMSAILFVVILAAVGIFVVVLYNRLIRDRNDVKNAWSAIEVQLKRRHDLIPNIVEAVKGYASHERQTLDAVIQARRNALTSSGGVEATAKAENALSGTLRSLFALSEAYPNLKASESFMALQKELAATENKIGFARQFYNDTAMKFKNDIEMFPGNIVAGIFNFRAEPFFQMEDSKEREVPQVKF